ncbi:PD-(D/E)XK nuclease family protein [Micromonospora sp. NBC_00362]|uniref:PD-(D/E)XK nuclease family protein n=1 Tax=Micromonospora sp. NBC_00362 TaxID=2975975 RepID=UPI0022578D59|nr:PD-(D/E)XK nuclease family protein [Micromonospora sp. NBC_00362]MCX5119237.1 PD-(D/E)XK nuclease family protein [Micromonospora sp. NBC_00362]
MTHRLVYNDSTHSYTLNGKRCKSVTAVAKIVPDSYALEQWRKRQVAIGMTLEPRLAERVAVDLDNRETVDRVCEDAMQVAGAHHAANRGTQRHRASELADLGGKLLTEQQRADAAAWQRTLDAYGIEILPEFVEGFAIWPEYGVVGRFDRIARYRGRHVIVDLKSGENAVKYPQGTAVQLALYANAPLISAGIDVAGDRSTVTDWTTPPADLDLEHGYVVLLGDGMDVGQLWRIKIGHGWRGAQLGLGVVQWRKEYRYGAELSSQETSTTPTPDLIDLINRAGDEPELDGIWRTYASAWTPEHSTAAQQRLAAIAAGAL